MAVFNYKVVDKDGKNKKAEGGWLFDHEPDRAEQSIFRGFN